MRSGTSFFNGALGRKTMLRFWPLWTLYTLVWLFVLPLSLLTRYFDRLRWGEAATLQTWLLERAIEVPDSLMFGVSFAAVYGV